MIIDILIGVGYKGGVENVVNSTVSYMIKCGHRVRIVQLIELGYSWAEPKAEFCSLTASGDCELTDIEYFANRYREFLNENTLPDIILATSWPNTAYIAREAVKNDNGKIPIISWMHGSIEACAELGLGGYEELKYADAHLAINHKYAERISCLTNAEVIEVVNPIDRSRIVYSDQRNTRKLAYVGRIAPEKNIPFIINALKYASPVWSLDIVGDSDEEGNGVLILSDYCKQLGVEDRVRFHGWLDNPWGVLTDTYALVLPSMREGSPLVVVEAMLCGIPVISTPTDGVLDKIIPGKNGYLFPYNDTDAFLQLLRFAENDSLPQLIPMTICESVQYVLQDKPLADLLDSIIALKKKLI